MWSLAILVCKANKERDDVVSSMCTPIASAKRRRRLPNFANRRLSSKRLEITLCHLKTKLIEEKQDNLQDQSACYEADLLKKACHNLKGEKDKLVK